MLPLTGDIKEGVTYIRRDGTECTVTNFIGTLVTADDGWIYGPIGHKEQFVLFKGKEDKRDIVGIKE